MGHPAIDPENGVRMDIRVSKHAVEDFDELIDVQVTSPFCGEAAGKVGKATSNAESKKRTKYRRAVVTPAIVEPMDEGARPSEPSSPESPPDDMQARVGSKTP